MRFKASRVGWNLAWCASRVGPFFQLARLDSSTSGKTVRFLLPSGNDFWGSSFARFVKQPQLSRTSRVPFVVRFLPGLTRRIGTTTTM